MLDLADELGEDLDTALITIVITCFARESSCNRP